MYRIVLRPQVEQDIAEAQGWYEQRRPGLGRGFLSAVDDAIANAAEEPLRFAQVHGPTRRAVLRRFPSGLYFRVAGDEIVVLAVMHGGRDPRRWQSRR